MRFSDWSRIFTASFLKEAKITPNKIQKYEEFLSEWGMDETLVTITREEVDYFICIQEKKPDFELVSRDAFATIETAKK